MVNFCVTDTTRWFCDSLWKVTEYREVTLTSPLGFSAVSHLDLKVIKASLEKGYNVK